MSRSAYLAFLLEREKTRSREIDYLDSLPRSRSPSRAPSPHPSPEPPRRDPPSNTALAASRQSAKTRKLNVEALPQQIALIKSGKQSYNIWCSQCQGLTSRVTLDNSGIGPPLAGEPIDPPEGLRRCPHTPPMGELLHLLSSTHVPLDLVSWVKTHQRTSPEFKAQWIKFCSTNHKGVRDPSRLPRESISAFHASYTTNSHSPPAASSAGPSAAKAPRNPAARPKYRARTLTPRDSQSESSRRTRAGVPLTDAEETHLLNHEIDSFMRPAERSAAEVAR